MPVQRPKRLHAPSQPLFRLASSLLVRLIALYAARRLLAEAIAAATSTGGAAASADEAPILAFALSAQAPIIIPEEVDPQNPELVAQALGMTSAAHAGSDGAVITLTGLDGGAAPAAAPGASAAPAGAPQVGALGAGDDCASVRWRVERAAYVRQAPLQPADLWSAQVARRRAGSK